MLLALDGLDGFVARRLGVASEFGAHFDMEVDALMVLTLGAMLWQEGPFGAWTLWPGLLRYGYVALLAIVPGHGEEPRSRFGRLAFGGVVVGLLAGLCDGGRIGTTMALVGTALVTLSFGRSFYFSYRRS